MATDQTVDFVVMFLTIGLLVLGLGSVLLGWAMRQWDRFRGVNHSQGVVSSDHGQTGQTGARQKAVGINDQIPVSVSVSGTDTAGFDLASVPSDLTYEEVVAILAGQVTPDGKPVYSGKKIYSLVGGNYNEFTALMRQLRARDGAPAEPPASVTPIAGRSTRATFQETDPDLAYYPPE